MILNVNLIIQIILNYSQVLNHLFKWVNSFMLKNLIQHP